MARYPVFRIKDIVDIAQERQRNKLDCVIAWVGKRGCLPKGTKVRTRDGVVSIERAKNVLSYHMKWGFVESKPCDVFNAGKKQVWEIETYKGIIKCSSEHKWIIQREGKIMEVITSDLKDTDCLLEV